MLIDIGVIEYMCEENRRYCEFSIDKKRLLHKNAGIEFNESKCWKDLINAEKSVLLFHPNISLLNA